MNFIKDLDHQCILPNCINFELHEKDVDIYAGHM